MGVQASGAGESSEVAAPAAPLPCRPPAAAAARPKREVAPPAPPLLPGTPAASGCMCTGVREKRLLLRAVYAVRKPVDGVELPPPAAWAAPRRDVPVPPPPLRGIGEGEALLLKARASPGVRPAPATIRLERGRGKERGELAASGPCRSMASTLSYGVPASTPPPPLTPCAAPWGVPAAAGDWKATLRACGRPGCTRCCDCGPPCVPL
jgi:hypothetical protein